MSFVNFSNICKKYDNAKQDSVSQFNLEIQKGEFIAFVGPSGCGKSTTLRMIAGLEEITGGELSIDGKVVNNVHPKDRDIAMVFQNYALYPHMTVYDNIAFALQIKKVDKKIIEEKVSWAANILGLTDYLSRKPKDLSGGQRQRVALGRAIVRNPKVFLMDEPLSNLDAKLRVSMRNEITSLHKKLNSTTIYVTHDQIEAMTMADRIVVMKDGIIQQIGTPLEIYNAPKNTFVAGFIGAPQINLVEAKIVNNTINLGDNEQILPEGVLKKLEKFANSKVIVGIRPEHIDTENLSLSVNPQNTLTCLVYAIERMGHEEILYVSNNDLKLTLKTFVNRANYNVGDEVTFNINYNKVHFYDNDSKEILS